jgi:uncharacterized membrane protein SirB2
LEAVSAAVGLKPPVYCYPVSDLESEAPVGWTSGMSDIVPALRDCILLQPGNNVINELHVYSFSNCIFSEWMTETFLNFFL